MEEQHKHEEFTQQQNIEKLHQREKWGMLTERKTKQYSEPVLGSSEGLISCSGTAGFIAKPCFTFSASTRCDVGVAFWFWKTIKATETKINAMKAIILILLSQIKIYNLI